MFRPKVKSVYMLAPMLTVAILASGCSTPPEENLVKQFFRASGLRDNQTLANFAMVSFDAKTDGTVASAKVVSVSPVRTEPLKVQELAKALAEAEAANKTFTDGKKAYQEKNIEAIDRVLKAQSTNKKLSGADGKVQAEWEKWQSDTAAEAKKVSAAREALANARPIAELSLTTGNGATPEIGELDGNMESKDITVDATVKAPDGSTSQKQLVMTVQRAVVKAAAGAAGERNGKWIITGIKPA
ncbi:MAG: hypothetical protein ND807_02580 [Vicinamibacterales bacterium]|nr:hypothetical protein [Vicinamibacterales bacterium]